MEKYEFVRQIGSGSYSYVFKAKNIKSGEDVAIKKYNRTNEEIISSEMNYDSYREINLLKRLCHPNIIPFQEACISNSKSNNLYLVLDFAPETLYDRIHERYTFSECESVRSALIQLLTGIEFIHSHGFIHRDLKPKNILFKGERLLIADFGQSKEVTNPLNLTPSVTTIWYRAPEVLLGKKYTENIDIWSIGCILYEMIHRFVLFKGENDIDQLQIQFKRIGTPDDEACKKFPTYSALNFQEDIENQYILESSICYSGRKTAEELLDYLEKTRKRKRKMELTHTDFWKETVTIKNAKNWKIITEWLFEVKEECKYHIETIILACRIFSFFENTVGKNDLQGYAIVSFRLSILFFEKDFLISLEMTQLTNNSYTLDQFQTFEIEIGKKFEWVLPTDGIRELLTCSVSKIKMALTNVKIYQSPISEWKNIIDDLS